jgi:membrane protease YdiL (CAAX protease family)
LTAPEDTEPGEMTVKWGLPESLGSLVLTVAIAVGGAAALVPLAASFRRQHLLLWEIAAYQFLVLGVALSVLFFIVLPRRGDMRSLAYRFPGLSALAVAASVVVLILVGLVVLQLVFQTFFPGYHLQGNTQQEIPTRNGVSLPVRVVVFVWAALEAPLAEETLFRGILFQGLRHFADRWLPYQVAVFLAAVVSGAIFGLAHNEPHTLPILIFMGIALAYVFQVSRSIYASALVHGLINALAIIRLFSG